MEKRFRIKKSLEIENIIKLRKSVGNNYFVIYKNLNHENIHFRYAVSVPKKYGNAVERNKIKRQVRSVVRQTKINKEIDFFIVIKTSAKNLDFRELNNHLTNLMRKLNIIEGIKNNE